MSRLLVPRDLLVDLQQYLFEEENNYVVSPDIIKSFIEEIGNEINLDTCPHCGGPMAWGPTLEDTFCGSWLYMEGGCPPVPTYT